jgi:hypothetical protein
MRSWTAKVLQAWGLAVAWWPKENFEGLDQTEQWALTYGALRDDSDQAYSLAREYAQERYDELVALAEGLDKKLDELARTALTIGTIVATVARVMGLDTALTHSPLAAAAIVCSAAAVIVAAVARRPNKTLMPMNARTLLEAADLEPKVSKERLEGVMAASYHFAATGMMATVERKAEQLKLATSMFCLSLALIALLLIWPRPNPSSHPRQPGALPQSSVPAVP